MGRIIHGKPVVPGAAQGIALVSSEPISFWGGYDYHSGEIIDRRHPLSGRRMGVAHTRALLDISGGRIRGE